MSTDNKAVGSREHGAWSMEHGARSMGWTIGAWGSELGERVT